MDCCEIEVTLALRQAIRLFYKSTCQYCGASGASDVDHIIPRSTGGLNVLGNVTLACDGCNSRKNRFHLDLMFLAIAHARAKRRAPDIVKLAGEVKRKRIEERDGIPKISRFKSFDRLGAMASARRVPLNAHDMQLWHPTLFRSQKSAAHAREQFGDVRKRLEGIVQSSNLAWAEVAYSVSGQGQKDRTIFCPFDDIADLWMEACKHHGDITRWNIVGQMGFAENLLLPIFGRNPIIAPSPGVQLMLPLLVKAEYVEPDRIPVGDCRRSGGGLLSV